MFFYRQCHWWWGDRLASLWRRIWVSARASTAVTGRSGETKNSCLWPVCHSSVHFLQCAVATAAMTINQIRSPIHVPSYMSSHSVSSYMCSYLTYSVLCSDCVTHFNIYFVDYTVHGNTYLVVVGGGVTDMQRELTKFIRVSVLCVRMVHRNLMTLMFKCYFSI